VELALFYTTHADLKPAYIKCLSIGKDDVSPRVTIKQTGKTSHSVE